MYVSKSREYWNGPLSQLAPEEMKRKTENDDKKHSWFSSYLPLPIMTALVSSKLGKQGKGSSKQGKGMLFCHSVMSLKNIYMTIYIYCI